MTISQLEQNMHHSIWSLFVGTALNITKQYCRTHDIYMQPYMYLDYPINIIYVFPLTTFFIFLKPTFSLNSQHCSSKPLFHKPGFFLDLQEWLY